MGGDLSRPPNVLKFLHVKIRRKSLNSFSESVCIWVEIFHVLQMS